MSLGEPREHHETIGSTNERARELAEEGAAHGTLVTAGEQTAGRGRQGRSWATPPGVAIAASLVLREFDELLPLRAGLAVADVAGPSALVKWPNDVWVDGTQGRRHPRRGARRVGGAGHRRQRRRRRRPRSRPTPPRWRARSGATNPRSSRRWPSCSSALEARLGEEKRGRR